jgi:hypothetical protein
MKRAALSLSLVVAIVGAGELKAQAQEAGCTEWVNPSPGTTIYAPGDYESFLVHLADGSSVEAGPVVLGQAIELDQPATGATKCADAPEPDPTPEPTPDKTPDPEPTPAPPEDPTYVTACGMAEVVAIGDGWTYNGTPIVKGHVLNDGDTIVHTSGATYTFAAPTEDYCTEVVVPTPTPDVVIPPPPIDRPVCHEWQPCWDCEVHGNGECGPPGDPATPVPAGDPCAPPPVDRYEEPTCLAETGAGDWTHAYVAFGLIAAGALLVAWGQRCRPRNWLDSYLKGHRP